MADEARPEMTEEVASVFDFDPFGPGETIEPEGDETPRDGLDQPEEQSPSAEEPTEQPKAEEVPKAEPESPSPDDDPGEPDELAALREQISSLKNQLAQQQKQPQPQPQPQQPQPQQKPTAADDLPAYEFDVPDQFLQALDSDDPGTRKVAIKTLMHTVARNTHQLVRDEVRRDMQSLQTRMPQQVQQMQQTREQAQSIHSDFYGKHPKLNDPRFYDTVSDVARAVMQEKGYNAWNAEFREEVAKRAYQRLGFRKKQEAAAAPKAPPKLIGQGARPAAPSNQSAEDEISDTLFG